MMETINRIEELLKKHGPSTLQEDENTLEYLCGALLEVEDDITSIESMLTPFFEDEAETAAHNLAEKIIQLKEIPPSTVMTTIITAPKKHPVEMKKVQPEIVSTTDEEKEEDEDREDDNEEEERKDSGSYEEKRRKQEERKLKRLERKKRKDKKKTKEAGKKVYPSTMKQEDEFVDDDVSAWKERLAEGKAWGGRGHGGRGVRGDVNTAKNIHLSNVTLQFAGNELLQNSTIQMNGNHRYGLVGRNGVGKSTLLRRLAAKAIPGMPQHLRILLVHQQIAGDAKKTALQTLVESHSQRKDLLEEQNELEELLEKGQVQEEIVDRLGEIAVELDGMDAERAIDRARDILKGLQFTKNMMEDIPTESLSGGWRMRLALAQALFVPSDLVLMDEPTNHLDLHALMWLSNYLSNSNHTVIVVSHDRAFLNICTDIITMEHKKLSYFVGNYSAYELQQQEKAAHQAQIIDASERQRAKALAFVQKHEGNKKGMDPKKQRQAKMIKEKKLDRIGNHRDDGKRYKQFSLAKLSEDEIRLAQKVHIEVDDPIIRMRFPNPTWPSGILSETALIRVERMSFRYKSQKKFLLHDITVNLNRGSKIALVGRNGAGKSTLLKLISDDLRAEDHKFLGSVWRHSTLRVGHIGQYSVESLEKQYSDMTVLEYGETVLKSGKASSNVIANSHGNIRQYLGAFGMGGKLAHRMIRSLSGGERMRLCFATVLAEQPHLLVMDEPTNHLDLETLDSLSSALNIYQGAVMIVSHNQSFLSGFCKELWIMEGGYLEIRHSETESFDEMFSNYRSHALSGAESRITKRQTKALLAKKATEQRVGVRAGTGFIS